MPIAYKRRIRVDSGHTAPTRDLDLSAEARVAKASNDKTRVMPVVDGLADVGKPDVTKRDDALVTTMHEIRAVLDQTGGQLPWTGVDRCCVLDRSAITPRYLATVITGSWNACLQTGTTIQRTQSAISRSHSSR